MELSGRSGQHAGYGLLKHNMKVGAAKAVGADPATTGIAVRLFPGTRFMDQEERRLSEVDVGIGSPGIQRRRVYLVMSCQDRLQ